MFRQRRTVLLTSLLLGVFGILAAGQDATAQTLKLRLEQVGIPGSLTITDNGPGDSNSQIGRIRYSGAYGTFSMTVETGISKPILGGPTQAEIDLNSSNFSSPVGGTLIITLEDTNFINPPNAALTMKSGVGGTMTAPDGSTVTFNAYADPGNAVPFVLDTDVTSIPGTAAVASLGTFGPGAFSNVATTTFTRTPGGNYSIFVQATIDAKPGESFIGFDFDTKVNAPPCTGSIGDFVWNDLNHNGIQDSGEPGFSSILLNLYKSPDFSTPIATTTTTSGGFYQFSGLCAGTYRVTVVTPPAGYTPTTPTAPGSTTANDSNGSPADVTLPTDFSTDITIDFGYFVVPPSATCVAITAVQGVAITPVTMVGSGGVGGPYTFSATGLPAGLTMSSGGTISGTPTVSGTFSYTVTVTDAAGNTGSVSCSVTVNPPPSATCVSITAVQGVAITPVTMVGSGGVGGPYTFSATGLPAGLTMSSGGTISGTPTVSGTFSYTVTVKDAAGNTGTVNCSVTVINPSTRLTTKSAPTIVEASTGQTIIVTETNTGDSTITNVYVTGTGLCSSYTPASIPSLAPGASQDFSCAFTSTVSGAWSATGHGTDLYGNPVSLTNETTGGTVSVIHPATVLTTKSVSPGTTVTAGTPVTIIVTETNTGDSAITNAFVTGTGCTSWSPASVASLPVGFSVDFICTFTPTSATSWTATGQGTDVLSNPVPLTGETTSGTITVTTPQPCAITTGQLGASSGFSLLALNGGSMIINSSTSIRGDVGYSSNVVSTTNQKVTTFIGTAYVHSTANFVYTAATFQPTGGIVRGGTADTKLNQANSDAAAAAAYFAALPSNGSLGNVNSSLNLTATGAITVFDATSWLFNTNTLTLNGNDTSVFVFRVTGSFDWSDSQTRLNGVLAANVVFYFPNASNITINKSTNIFAGTVLAPTGSVIYHNPASFDGRIIAHDIDVHSDFNIAVPQCEKTFTIGPSSMEGAIKISNGDWVNGGYSFAFKNNTHIATNFSVAANVKITGPCSNGGTDSVIVPLGSVTYAVPAGNTSWLPTGDANSVLSWQGSVRVGVTSPAICGGVGTLDASKGAVYTATVSQFPSTGSLVDFRFKYRDPAAKGKPNTNCLDTSDPNRAKADVCGASWSQTVTDP